MKTQPENLFGRIFRITAWTSAVQCVLFLLMLLLNVHKTPRFFSNSPTGTPEPAKILALEHVRYDAPRRISMGEHLLHLPKSFSGEDKTGNP
ncbi:MAG: hypothetical protein Tsb009_09410 [Planctomycetaceae bacterium]